VVDGDAAGFGGGGGAVAAEAASDVPAASFVFFVNNPIPSALPPVLVVFWRCHFVAS
jgi:hypothetical protein